jgi:hypothetical protein
MPPDKGRKPKRAAGVPPVPVPAPPVTQPPAQPTGHKKTVDEKPGGRLPAGAKFAVAYDATMTRWTGTLTIGEQVFTGSAGGVFKLLNQLDRQYRDSLPPTLPQSSG